MTPAALAIVTTCRGRLEHLKITLPLMLRQGSLVVLVAQSCPDGSAAWARERYAADVAAGRLLIVEQSAPGWDAPLARNAGAAAARAAGAHALFFADADSRLGPCAVEAAAGLVAPGLFVVAGRRGAYDKRDVMGLLVVHVTDFESVGGYDSRFAGAAGEDCDLRLRLALAARCRWAALSPEHFTPIEHPDELRTRFAPRLEQGHALIARLRGPLLQSPAAKLLGRFRRKTWSR